MLPIIWFAIVAVMVALYVVLDGFDIGAGIIHLCVARNIEERRLVLKSIGPVWDGNEVWLIAGGGALFCAFPLLYASAFSGFYLPLMVVLWLLILRGIAIEFRNQLNNALWTPLWDTVFSLASAMLAVFYGAALGNVVRGVPLDANHEFFLPLWTNFMPGTNAGILDWYTLLTGAFAFLTLALHGALWINLKTEGEIQARARRVARVAWYAVAAFTAVTTFASWSIQPAIALSFAARPAGYLFPLLAVAGLAGMWIFLLRRAELAAFLASCIYIIGMLTSLVFGVFPNVLPSNADPALSLTIHNASAPESGLRIALLWFTPGIVLVFGYFVFLYRKFAGKVTAEAGH